MTDTPMEAGSEAPYIGELRLFSFGFAPKGWASCDGSSLPIQGNSWLFSLIGTTYGGNGSTTFNLPDLRARVPMHSSAPRDLGRQGGADTHTLVPAEMPMHNHQLVASNTSSGNVPDAELRLANSQPGNLYGSANNLTPMHPSVIGVTGGSEPHENRQPYLAVNICICLQGDFPPKSEEATP
jgi:microcystin-dependent protein